jgi:hypothetical protein
MTHLTMMVIFAALVAAVFAALMRDDARGQIRTGGRIFGALVVGAWIAGWIMFGGLG